MKSEIFSVFCFVPCFYMFMESLCALKIAEQMSSVEDRNIMITIATTTKKKRTAQIVTTAKSSEN